MPAGINTNAGEKINLRLRPPGSVNTFYEYDQLVLVMLHEVWSVKSLFILSVLKLQGIDGANQTEQLTHNEHGPHDAKFYKLLAELEEEYYDLKRKGYSGASSYHLQLHLLLV